ncbi:MAG: efflux RND transporter periplasmic adaptor subunit [Alphaproteobacteria bacterium]|nr:efflux RND transporter periplasmic adaptor subunit [Alphaproteobacteria bacterium]
MPVDVEIVKPESVRIWSEFSGRLSPVEYAVIQPQVGGKIMEIRFGDGQSVEKGDVLFVIDPRPYKAAQDQAQAALNAAQNQYELARKDMERAQGLIGMDAISGRVFDERQNTVRTALAAVEGAKAELQNAKINLEYAYIKAPISGRVGRAELTVGNVVQAGPSAPVLTSVVSSAGIYADFDVDEQTYLNHIFQNARGLAEEVKIPVQIALRSADGAEHVIEGRMHNFDNRINPDSGTIRARAIFENADGALLPGMFVKVRMGNPDEGAHILLSEKAIGTDQDRKFVYTVDETDTVKYRQVTLGDSAGDRRVILSGLNAGDRVIVEGVIRIRPDMPVQPVVKTAAGKDGVESAPPANPQALLPAEPKEQSMQPVETEE